MNQTDPHEERLALYIDYENLAIGARDTGLKFQAGPLADVLAERGRLVVRRAYADWHLFSEERRELVDSHVELIDIPQRGDSVRKNAADIKMAVDAMELALSREWVSTFVIASGDSDFTPLVGKLRELNRRVIGVGVEGSTSNMLPPACDEFIFYDRLENAPQHGGRRGRRTTRGSPQRDSLHDLTRVVTQTLAGLQRSTSGPVYSSGLKRALLRKDPTFSEADYGFRAFSELIRHLETEGHLEMREGPAPGDPEVDFAEGGGGERKAFQLLAQVVSDLEGRDDGRPPLSGLKDQIRKREPDFSEKDFGYSGFLQFCKAAATRGVIDLDFDEEEAEYYLRAR